MKLLLYCTKAKPYLVKRNIFAGVEPSYFTLKENVEDNLNGKIVAECDFEVEKIENKLTNNNSHLELFADSLTEKELFEKSCLNRYEMFSYLKNDFTKKDEIKGYAIHIKNLHIFDYPKELSEYYSVIDMGGGMLGTKPLTKAPQNMMHISINQWEYCFYNPDDINILISIRPEHLVNILNGNKTIEIRKKVLREMLK